MEVPALVNNNDKDFIDNKEVSTNLCVIQEQNTKLCYSTKTMLYYRYD